MPDSPPADAPRPARRERFGLSLRMLMLLVLLIGGGMGWYAYKVRIQRLAVAAIEAAGGKVYYDFEFTPIDLSVGQRHRFRFRGMLPTFAPPAASKPTIKTWLIEKLGPDYVASV